MINGYQTFVDYFRQLANNHVDIKDFVVGNSERILNRQTSQIDYPVLWLEIPDIDPTTNELKGVFNSAFLVLSNAPSDDWDQEETDLDEMLIICKEITARMIEDDEEGLFSFDPNSMSMQWKGKMTGDNDWGWRVNFRLEERDSWCVHDDKWADRN